MILLVHTYPGGSSALSRHQEYFNHAGADRIVAVTTTDGVCQIPMGWEEVKIGIDSYLNGDNLCRRLMDTIEYAISQPDDLSMIAEYDVCFFRPVNPPKKGFSSYRAGGQTWGSRNQSFHHPPWCADRKTWEKIHKCGTELLATGFVKYGSAESSPRLFYLWACETASIPMNGKAWKQFSRNSYDVPGDLQLAREAYLSGAQIIHGVKSETELRYIISGL